VRIHDAPQRSAEWFKARLGLPTASAFDNLLTPAGKPSASAERYLNTLLFEYLTGESLEAPATGFMQRGEAYEADAVLWYEWQRGVDTRGVGLCLRDDLQVGASPDRLVGDDGVLEIKTPNGPNHVAYLRDWRRLRGAYWWQIHGEMWVCERQWVDVVSFNPQLPSVLVRVERSPQMIAVLESVVLPFVESLNLAKAELRRGLPDAAMAGVGVVKEA